jgi:hypothetical protein
MLVWLEAEAAKTEGCVMLTETVVVLVLASVTVTV